MTTKEQQTVDSLLKAIQDLRTENAKFREDAKNQIEAINVKVDKKHTPIHLENDILGVVQSSITESVKSVLTGCNSPLNKLITSVVDENSTELRSIISDSFTTVIRLGDFKASIIDAFSHKVSRAIISNNDGLFDKVSNELKQDAIFKSKMSIAVANVVEECLTQRK